MSDLAWLTARPIAHRGLHDMNKTRWENTLAAFEAAAASNYAIECDVHITLDGEVVVFHDTDLKRLTGTEGYVWQRTGAEMTALTVGGTAEHVPTLAQMLELVAGRVPLVIELKGTPGHDDGLVAAVCKQLRRYKGKVAIMSFDHWLIRDFPKHAGDIPTGLTAWGSKPHEVEMHFPMLMHGVSFVSYALDQLPNAFATFVKRELGMPVITWTVRDAAAVAKTYAEGDQITFEGFDPDSLPSS